MANFNIHAEKITPRTILFWRIAQIVVWLTGVFILFNLIFRPKLGIQLFWNVLIPVAPLLLVVGVGVWRNICPMASFALFPRHIGISKRKKITITQTGKLNLIAVVFLLIVVPLRHAIFDTNGLATAILILSLGAVAVTTSFFYEWKSAWCSGLCPVHPVEKLYGVKNRISLPNAHCEACHRCVTPCPDTTPGIHPLSTEKTNSHKIAGLLIVGGFPGFIWGWFQIPDYQEITDVTQLMNLYLLPLSGLVITGALFLILKKFVKKQVLITVFSAASVSCYYWFRIPALFGYGIYPGDGMLIDLSGILPEWSLTLAAITTTIFFFWWVVFRRQEATRWVGRPVYADKR
ncbi:MAG: hypothetical protein R3C61_02220 [Bacteroidia bacterium]